MDKMVKDYLSAEIETSQEVTITSIDLNSVREGSDSPESGCPSYKPFLLCHFEDNSFAITGLAMLLPYPSNLYIAPGASLAWLSKYLLQSGDTTAVLAAA